ncbi:methyltransferase domain-containing protein [Candidatus Parcubacteria bacterium]|nr:MAG: methyltransferase domain-containing protein [Candidatus Parcubacteria bacterium]
MDYKDGEYLQNNPTLHEEDASWKAYQVLSILGKHELAPTTICEVGCGSGAVLENIAKSLDNVELYGYDIANYRKYWGKRNVNINFFQKDITKYDCHYDLLLVLDVVEHVEDYMGFLRCIKDKGALHIFNFPLEIFAFKALFPRKYLESRKKYGHIHYFNRMTAMATLMDCGYEIIDYTLAPAAIDLAQVTTSISRSSRMMTLPRKLLSIVSKEFTADVLGGYSLFVLAR